MGFYSKPSSRKRPWPPEFGEISRVEKQGFGNNPVHNIFVSDEFLKTLLMKPYILAHAADTPVMDVLNKVVTELLNRVKQVNCSWRWKIMKLLPTNMTDCKKFVQTCELKRDHICKVVEIIYHDVFPVENFGAKNSDTLIKLIVTYMTGNNVSEYPALKALDVSYLRAMRSKQFKAKLCAAGMTEYLESIYQACCHSFVELALETTVSIAMMFLERVEERHRLGQDGFPCYYSKRCFNFWKKKEWKLFKADYTMVRQDESVQGVKKDQPALVSKVMIVPSRSSLRPICPFPKKVNSSWQTFNEARELNAIMDHYLRNNTCGYPQMKGLVSIFKDIKSYLKSIPADKEVFFIKTDVTKAFANINKKLLDNCLQELIQQRTCVSVSRKTMTAGQVKTTWGFDFCAAAETSEDAHTNLKRLVKRRKRKFIQEDHHSKVNEWSFSKFGQRFWNMVEGLRFRVGPKPKHLYKMKKGVPQGFFLSSRLSHIYLSSFDRLLAPFRVKRFRFVDDYLFITENKEDAINLLDFLQRPKNDYGIQFRREKTETSFVCDYVKKPTTEITWCGGKIDTRKKKFIRHPTSSLVMMRKKAEKLNTTEKSRLRNNWKRKELQLHKEYNADITIIN